MDALSQNNAPAVMMKAFKNACKAFALTDEEAGSIVGVSRSTLSRSRDGFARGSKTYELQAEFVRLYRSLYALVGGDQQLMREWFNDENIHLHGIPRALCFRIAGLVSINHYLDAMRGKV